MARGGSRSGRGGTTARAPRTSPSSRPGRAPGRSRARARTRPPRGQARRPFRRRWLVLAAAVVGLVALAWLLFFSPVLDVADVEVSGAAPETTPAVRAAAEVPAGTSLLWLDTDAVAESVRTLPRVATVDVRRSLPGTLTVAVTEREPVAAAPVPGGVALVDDTGFAYRSIAAPPAGVPLLRLPPGAAPSPADPATLAAVRVLTSLPPPLRATVVEVRAGGPFAVELTVDRGRVVRWGADADNPRKAAVLTALLSRPGRTYDVSTPALAVVS